MSNVEIDKLKETLNEYADYAIKLVKENKRLQQENKQLKEDKKKAYKYLKEHRMIGKCVEYYELLEMLGE